MSEAKHTPAPWVINDEDSADLRIESAAYEDETPGVCGNHSKEWPLHSDDARLICAAPNLLASVGPSEGGTADFPDELIVVAKIIDTYDLGSGLGRHLRQRAETIRAAIAKATGAAVTANLSE